MKKEPCGRAGRQQEGGLSVTKDRSTKALSPSEVRKRRGGQKKKIICLWTAMPKGTKRLFRQTSGIRQVTDSGSNSTLTAFMSSVKM